MKNPHSIFFALMLFCYTAVAQKPAVVSAAVDKTSILIGEPLHLTLEATFSKPHTPSFFTVDSLPHFEILSRSKIDTIASDNQTTLKQVVTLTSWDSGAWLLPAFSVAGIKGNATKQIGINVTYKVTPPNQDYHDIKDIIAVKNPPRTTWYWYVIGAVLLLLLLLLVFPKKKKQPLAEMAVREGAYKQALKDLDALQKKNEADDKSYFTELSSIFRTYLHQAKGIHSFQQTTDDLCRQLQTLQLPHEDFKKLVETLQLSDFVKFARYHVSAAERATAWDEIKKNIVSIERLKK